MSMASTGWWIVAQMPGQNIHPEVPAEFVTKFDRILNFVMYFGIFVLIIGVIVAGIGAAISRREGSSEEVPATFLRIGIVGMVIGSVVSIVSFLL